MNLRFLLALPAALLLLTACTVNLVTPDGAAPAAAAAGAPAAQAIRSAPLTWAPCAEPLPATVECAQMQVPMDYATPDGLTITLGLARLPATDPDKRIGSLVFNPGGPGEVASEILGLQVL